MTTTSPNLTDGRTLRVPGGPQWIASAIYPFYYPSLSAELHAAAVTAGVKLRHPLGANLTHLDEVDGRLAVEVDPGARDYAAAWLFAHHGAPLPAQC